jgi:hypothetical protein
MATRAQVKEFFNFNDTPQEAEYSETFDSIVFQNEKNDHGHFAIIGTTGSNSATASDVVRELNGFIRYPASWAYGTNIYVTRINRPDPNTPWGSGNQVRVFVGSPQGGSYGTTMLEFINPVSVDGGFMMFTGVSRSPSSAGVVAQLVVSNATFEKMKTTLWSSPNPFAVNEPQPSDPFGYTSAYRINPFCVAPLSVTPTSTGSTNSFHNLGNGCSVVLNGTDAAQATYAVANGTGTLTLPAGVSLIRGTIQGSGSGYSAGSYANAFRLKIVGGLGNGSLTELVSKRPQVLNMENAGNPVTPTADIVYDHGLVKIHIDEVTSNSIAYVANKIGQYYNNAWALEI